MTGIDEKPGLGQDPSDPVAPFQVETAAQFANWLALALPGDPCKYHTGDLARDRVGPDGEPVGAVVEIAARVLLAAERGYIRIAQRRLGEGRYEYLAIKLKAGDSRHSAPGGRLPK